MREFAMIMMQQGRNGADNAMRPGYQNLHEDLYNEDEPMEDRYANLRPSSRIQEIEQDVLKEAGATDEQIKQYQEQIQQQKASFSTTNDQKLASVGIDPEIVKKIKAAKAAGTMQGTRNIKPYGPYINDPNFIASYNAGRTLWLSQQPEDRKTVKKPENFTFLAKNEDPWDIDYQDAVSQQPEDIFYDAKTETEEQEMMKMREELVKRGLRKDTMTKEERNLKKKLDEDIQEIINQNKAAKLLSSAVKGIGARKELRELKELSEAKQVQEKKRIDKIDEDNRNKIQAGKVITKAAQRYQANKQKKALTKKLKADLEAEIAKLEEELKAGSPEPRQPSAKSKGLNKAMESVKDFWKKDMSQEAARQDRKDTRQAKRDAQKEAEYNLTAKAKALQDKRNQLEAL
jgi:hypothetical protein